MKCTVCGEVIPAGVQFWAATMATANEAGEVTPERVGGTVHLACMFRLAANVAADLVDGIARKFKFEAGLNKSERWH